MFIYLFRIIPYEDIAAGNLLGTGVSGDVYQATWKRKQVAVKKFAKQKYNDRTLLELKAETAELSYAHPPPLLIHSLPLTNQTMQRTRSRKCCEASWSMHKGKT